MTSVSWTRPERLPSRSTRPPNRKPAAPRPGPGSGPAMSRATISPHLPRPGRPRGNHPAARPRRRPHHQPAPAGRHRQPVRRLVGQARLRTHPRRTRRRRSRPPPRHRRQLVRRRRPRRRPARRPRLSPPHRLPPRHRHRHRSRRPPARPPLPEDGRMTGNHPGRPHEAASGRTWRRCCGSSSPRPTSWPLMARPASTPPCACRKPRPRHATRRYSLIKQPVQVCLPGDHPQVERRRLALGLAGVSASAARRCHVSRGKEAVSW